MGLGEMGGHRRYRAAVVSRKNFQDLFFDDVHSARPVLQLIRSDVYFYVAAHIGDDERRRQTVSQT